MATAVDGSDPTALLRQLETAAQILLASVIPHVIDVAYLSIVSPALEMIYMSVFLLQFGIFIPNSSHDNIIQKHICS